MTASQWHDRCLPNRLVSYVPLDVYYHGYRIVWDTRQLPGTCFWTGRVAVVVPVDGSDLKGVYKITDSVYAASEEAARDCLIDMAKTWIDANVTKQPNCSSTAIEGYSTAPRLIPWPGSS